MQQGILLGPIGLTPIDEAIAASSLQSPADALRESEERLRLLLDHVGDAVIMLDPDGHVLTWTPAAERILGYDRAEALGRNAADFNPPDDPRRLASELATALREGRSEVDGLRTGKDDKAVWARVVLCPIRNGHEELRGFGLIVQDRTALRHAEELLEQRALELERSNEELEVFASVASHDLQEPLRKLRTFSDRLRKRFSTSLDADANALVVRMDEAAGRMQLLIDDLLAYSRLARNPQSVGEVDLNQIVREVLGDMSVAVDKAGAVVEVDVLPIVLGEPTRLRQLFQNLIANALKFSRSGVRARIGVRSSSSDDDSWHLRVEDNGIGFEPKYKERIFRLFQRLHGRSEYEGTGIGLAICRRILDGHGGTIAAEGSPGEGAAFVIRLPKLRQPRGRK